MDITIISTALFLIISVLMLTLKRKKKLQFSEGDIFSVQNANGSFSLIKILNKEDEINYVGSQGDAYENFSYEISSINLFENGTAIAYMNCRLTGVDLDGAYVTTYFQSCTMVKIENEWKVVGYHVSGVNDERIENAPTE